VPVEVIIGFAVGIVTLCFIIITCFVIVKNRKDLQSIKKEFENKSYIEHTIQYVGTKKMSFERLAQITSETTDRIIATRFSPGDISVESGYWKVIKEKAMDEKITSIRIHSLAHHDDMALNGAKKLIDELKGAKNFILGIAFFNNCFEIIISDDKKVFLCFHDNMHDNHRAIKNGFLLEELRITTAIVKTCEQMLNNCHIQIDFGRYVQNEKSAEQLKKYVDKMYSQYSKTRIVLPIIHHDHLDNHLRENVFVDNTTAQIKKGKKTLEIN
jgi:hypothetical protein